MSCILVLTSTFPCSERDPVPAFVKEQIIAMKKMRPEVEFIVLAPHSAASETSSKVVNKDYLEFRFHYFWPFYFERLAGHGIMPTLKKNPAYYFLLPFFIISEFVSLVRMVLKFKPDYVYAHWFTPQGIIAGFVSMLMGVPFVYTSHSSDVAILRKIPFFGGIFVRILSQRADAISVVSNRSLEKLQYFFPPKEWSRIKTKVKRIPMGVHLTRTSNINDTLKYGKKNILFIGRLVEKKGVQFLLPAFAEFWKDSPDVNLQIAGDGPWRKQLEDLAVELKIPKDRIEFLGYVSGKQKQNLISSCWVMVVPSIIASDGDSEGLPVVLLEALAAGKICGATYESGADDIISNSIDGFLIHEKNSLDILKFLRQVSSLKKKEILKIQEEAVKLAKTFDWSIIAEEHFQHLFRSIK